jgi:hypothetical protein
MGGSGGGASGTVSWPTYIQTVHGRWLDDAGTYTPLNNLAETIDAVYGNSPFLGAVAYDPAGQIARMDAILTSLDAALSARNNITDFTTAFNTATTLLTIGFPAPQSTLLDTATLDTTVLDTVTVSDDDIDADMAALQAVLEDDLENRQLPILKAGMLNIGATNTSSFVIGEAIMRAMVARDVAKHGSELRVQLNTQARDINARHALAFREVEARHKLAFREIEARHKVTFQDISARFKLGNQELLYKFFVHNQEMRRLAAESMMAALWKHMDAELQYTHQSNEAIRLETVMKKEELEEQLSIDEADVKWDLELFRYAGNLIAGPSGGVAQTNEKKSKAIMALGGAISGAAAGAAVGAAIGTAASPGIGTAAGALLGVGMSLL